MARKFYVTCPKCRNYHDVCFHKIGSGYYECEYCKYSWTYEEQQSRDPKLRIVEVWE